MSLGTAAIVVSILSAVGSGVQASRAAKKVRKAEEKKLAIDQRVATLNQTRRAKAQIRDRRREVARIRAAQAAQGQGGGFSSTAESAIGGIQSTTTGNIAEGRVQTQAAIAGSQILQSGQAASRSLLSSADALSGIAGISAAGVGFFQQRASDKLIRDSLGGTIEVPQ